MRRSHRFALTALAVGAVLAGGAVAAGAGQRNAADSQPSGTTQVGIGTGNNADPTTLVQLTASS